MYIIIIVLAVIVFLILCTHKAPTSKDDLIKILTRQAARWSVAAQQDQNAMIAVLHANYGAGYLWALNDIATTSEIEEASGINYQSFRDEIVKIQDAATKRMATLCPAYAPAPSVLTKISGEQG